MSCNIEFYSNGEVKSVVTDSGIPSKLYLEAEKKYGQREALNIFYVSQSDDFKETIPPVENINAKVIGDKYTKLIAEIKASQPEEYWSVDQPSIEVIKDAAENGRIVDVQGGMGIVTEEGNMIGLFKYDSAKKGTSAAVQAARVKIGGIKLDNYDGYLTKLNKSNGFKVVSRVLFDETYAPPGWNKELHGTPDVVFMIYDPSNKVDSEEKTFKDYNEAKEYRDTFVEEVRAIYPLIPKEPTLEEVMKYITSQNEIEKSMNEEQTQDYKNSLIGTKGFTFENLKKALYDEYGVFFISPNKLVASGLYSQYEAENLQRDIELQKRVKSSVEALKNTGEEILINQENFEQVEKENLFNSFGKLSNLNPYIVQKQIQNTLAATTREEFDEVIGELPFSNFQKSVASEESKDELFKYMQEYKKAEMMIEVNGEIKPSLNSNTEVIVTQTAQDLVGTKVLSDIDYILSVDINILKATTEETSVLINSIEKGLIENGYDAIGLSSKAIDDRLIIYLNAVKELTEISTKIALNNYVEIYNTYFEKDINPKKGFVKTKQDDRSFVKADTELKEGEVYEQQGLIKQEDGLYIRVNKKSSEELYPIVVTYPERLPAGVKTEQELRKYIQSSLKNNEVLDSETGEVISLFKMYYGIPQEAVTKEVATEDFNRKMSLFTGDAEYLKSDFISDFYIESLKEKAKESPLYRNFYRHFEITNKGIELINNDPITLESIKPYVEENLANYSILSKSMPNLKEDDVEFVNSRNNRRNLISNNINILPKFEGNLSILDSSNLIVKNGTSEFIKVKNELYENLQAIGNLTLYSKLSISKGNYNNFAVEKAESKYRLEDYLHLENKPELFIKINNYLSKEEKNKLDNDEFGCL